MLGNENQRDKKPKKLKAIKRKDAAIVFLLCDGRWKLIWQKQKSDWLL